MDAPRAKIHMDRDKIRVTNADELTVIIDIRTDYKNQQYKELCKQTVRKAASKSYKALKKKHINDFQPLFERVSLNIEGEESFDHLPTDQRWKRLKEGKADEGLIALFFQYGRYLLLAASRANSPLPVALQGPFNDNLACHMCWTSDYHLDINTQQNYWIANVGNLAECNLPLFSYIKDLSMHGAKTAEVVYGCKGWTAHTVANIWGFTAPSAGIGYGLFPTASSWMASHLWTQYEYTLDKKSLTVMDRWILSKLNSTVGAVDDNLANYRIPEAAKALQEFVDDLSNWYVRRSRERFWAKGMEQDKINAYMTLYTALVTICKAAAPMIPFMTEEIYRNLV